MRPLPHHGTSRATAGWWVCCALVLSACSSTSTAPDASAGGQAGGGQAGAAGGAGAGADDAGPTHDAGPDTTAWASGTRLKARTLSSGDAGVLLGFYDTQLQSNCDFARDQALAYRCFAADTSAQLAGFEDAACTRALAYVGACTADAGTVLVDLQRRCIGLPSMKAYRLGALVNPTTLFVLGDDGCHPIDGQTDTFARLEPVPDSVFASAHVETAGTPPLGVEVLVSSDGARQVLGPWRFDTATACVLLPQSAELGVPVACLAGEPAYDFGDLVDRAQCSVSFAYSVAAPECGDRITYLKYGRDGGDYPLLGYFEATQVDAGSVVFGDARTATCSAQPATRGSRYWKSGAAVGTLPTSAARALGGGAARPLYFVASDDRPAAAFGFDWLDADAGVRCQPWRTVDAGVRCVGRYAVVEWLDSSCQTSAVAWSEGSTDVALELRDVPCSDTLISAVYPLGAQIARPTELYDLVPGVGCVSTNVQATGAYHSLGPALPFDVLPRLDEATAP